MASAETANLQQVQAALLAKGYEVGTADGIMGPRTRSAIRAFEADHDMPVTGNWSEALAQKLTAPRQLAPIVLRPPLEMAEEVPVRAEAEPAAKREPEPPPLLQTVFANRNWLVRDLDAAGRPTGSAIGLFLEANGKVAGPRFAANMRWRADGDGLTLVYESPVGKRIERSGRPAGPDRIIGTASGAGDAEWRWEAEAKPLDPS